MKKFIIALVALITMTVQASAMSYQQARDQALFLTDKMAYELNLTDEQYEAAYEINLDYLMGVNSYDDLYGVYWRQRNLDLSYILLDWQYSAYCAATYFYRPLYWDGGYWHFGVYARYPHRDYFFFDYPTVYVEYRGGHSWRMNGGRSWYRDRHFAGPDRNGGPRVGMRDQFDRGDFGRGYTANNRSFGNGSRLGNSSRPFGSSNSRSMSTRNRSFGNGSSVSRQRSFGNGSSQQRNRQFGGTTRQNRTRSFGTSSQSRSRSFGNSERQSSTRTTVTRPSNSNRSFGGHFSSSTPQRTFTPNNGRSSRSFSPTTRSMSSSSRSFSAPSRSSSSFRSSSRSFGNSGSSHSSSHSGGGHFSKGK